MYFDGNILPDSQNVRESIDSISDIINNRKCVYTELHIVIPIYLLLPEIMCSHLKLHFDIWSTLELHIVSIGNYCGIGSAIWSFNESDDSEDSKKYDIFV